MPKKRSTPNSELRTSPLPLSLHKYGNLSAIQTSMEKVWGIREAQPFFPSIEKLFKVDELENPTIYGIRFKDEISGVVADDKIKLTTGSEREVHRKVSMILSPYKWMQGKYGMNTSLPSTTEQADRLRQKLQTHNNYAYVGSLISAVLSESGCVHFPKVYGVFSGISASHKIDISDDYGELCERPWFSSNIGKTFEVSLSESVKSHPEFSHTRSARVEVQLGEEITLEGLGVIETTPITAEEAEVTQIFKDEEADDGESDSSSVSTSYVFAVRSCDCEDDEDDEDDDGTCEGEDSEEEPFAWATFKDVPVQVTVMEKCLGTLYELIVMNPEPEKHLAWISQVIFALAYAQRNFGLTHNDLHANNVMYVETDKEFLFYNCGGVLYKVPTFGYIIKIIDFERGVASVKLSGMKESKLFMSDHFSPNEEAGGQYNYQDYYIPKFPEIKPSPSFDLCRLATSLYWDLFVEPDETNPLFSMFVRWLTQDDGESVMFSKLDEYHDRYHGFHLYKAIARYCKENAIPRKEIANLKSKYEVTSIDEGYTVLSIDF